MLKRFEVKGFKQFGHLVLDFSKIREYGFNQSCIKNGLVKDALVYGRNASGKSNLGLALFDLVSHLTDKTDHPELYRYYLKADENRKTADFSYEFQFDRGHRVHYDYTKENHQILDAERLEIDGKRVLQWPDQGGIFIDQEFRDFYGFGNININYHKSDLSAVKYVLNNMTEAPGSVMTMLKEFVNGMLWFQRNDLNNRYIGFTNAHGGVFSSIIEKKYTKDFEQFLREYADMPVTLETADDPAGNTEIYFTYTNKRKIPVLETSSSGTKALALFFYWLKQKAGIKFLFIDEFDAFYHYELAEKIFRYLVSGYQGQAVVTTHNLNLLTNRITRPDCCFVVKDGAVRSFADATSRTLRRGNDLERLYLGGEFDG